MGEISETGCLGGKLCCVKEGENQRYQDAHKPALPSKDESSGPQDYVVLPTITLLTTQPWLRPSSLGLSWVCKGRATQSSGKKCMYFLLWISSPHNKSQCWSLDFFTDVLIYLKQFKHFIYLAWKARTHTYTLFPSTCSLLKWKVNALGKWKFAPPLFVQDSISQYFKCFYPAFKKWNQFPILLFFLPSFLPFKKINQFIWKGYRDRGRREGEEIEFIH